MVVELAALTKRGRLSPKLVVAWARGHRQSALHSYFEWDDTKAAERHRIWQARELIVSVEAVYEDGKRRQVYVSPVSARGRGGYVALTHVMSSAQMRREFLDQALEELERVCNRYNDLAELAGVREAVRLVRSGRSKAA